MIHCMIDRSSLIQKVALILWWFRNNRHPVLIEWFILIHDDQSCTTRTSIHDPYVWEVPVREHACPGLLALWGRVASSFPRPLFLPSVSTGSPFAAGWTVNELLTIGSMWVLNRGLRHSRQALLPLCLSPIIYIYKHFVMYVRDIFPPPPSLLSFTNRNLCDLRGIHGGIALFLETINIPSDKTYTTIQGLEPSTVYVNKVAAVNKHGTGSFSSSYVIKTDPVGVTPPNAVSSIKSGSITSSSIQLNWPAPRFVNLHKIQLCGLITCIMQK